MASRSHTGSGPVCRSPHPRRGPALTLRPAGTVALHEIRPYTTLQPHTTPCDPMRPHMTPHDPTRPAPLLPRLATPRPPMHGARPSPQAPTALTRRTDAPLTRAHHTNMLPPTHVSSPTTCLATLPTHQNPQHAVFSKFYANRITDSRCVLSRVAPCTRADHHGHTLPLLDVSQPPSTRSDAFRHILQPLHRPAHPNNPSCHVSQHDRPTIHPHPYTVRPSESYSPRWSDVARPALCTGLANGCWTPRCPTRARRPQS